VSARGMHTAAIALFLVVATGAGACGVRSQAPTGSASPRSSALPHDAPSATSPSPAATLTPPTASRPLRVWIGGDSHVGTLAIFLSYDLEQTGVVTPSSTYRDASGLADPKFFDWPATVRAEVAGHHPRAAVVVLGTNDARDMVVDGAYLGFGSREWLAEYRRRVRSVIDILREGGVQRIYWVGAPIIADREYGPQLQVVNDCIRAEVERQADAVEYIDAWRLFAAPGGGYDQRWRQQDGVHFNTAGAKRLAAEVERRISADWSIGRQP
jgi:uncharacterized protein